MYKTKKYLSALSMTKGKVVLKHNQSAQISINVDTDLKSTDLSICALEATDDASA